MLFLLHGLGGLADWLDSGRLVATLDRLVGTGAVPPMIVVMPGMGDGWYVDNTDPEGLGAVITDGGHGWGLWAREIDPVLRFVGTRFRVR